MQIIKDRQIIENNWSFIEDDQALPTGNVIISVSRWQTGKPQLQQHVAQLGLRLQPSDNVADIAQDLAHFDLIDLHFPVFTDGRGFSQAKLLRDRYQYAGEIRASGNFMVDQVFYMTKVGINAFELNNEKQLPLAISLMDDFSVSYQELLFA
ncbi:DUF934 domain-containing protein [methane-oxidizing endosymbiont of Gigantopelta aegis]|uniref:DUF934 domain-containing protein n=1 Tax=methane-oxidizing endosymbiont of Gigantopelta aegis TaxID=2794938 RepID=UPI0018DBDA06|nr:DUF934 domain-containing protein [methane-oxidizing endosymbiont of Gigantopelta aegis]